MGHRRDGFSAVVAARDEDALAGHRRERRGDEQLRVVAKAHAPREIGPRPVEDELTFAVGLEVRRRDRDELFAAMKREVRGRPPHRVLPSSVVKSSRRPAYGGSVDTPRLFEAIEPGVLDEG